MITATLTLRLSPVVSIAHGLAREQAPRDLPQAQASRLQAWEASKGWCADFSRVDLQASPQQASQPAKKKKVDATSAAGGSAETIEQRQKEARKWINDWRAR